MGEPALVLFWVSPPVDESMVKVSTEVLVTANRNRLKESAVNWAPAGNCGSATVNGVNAPVGLVIEYPVKLPMPSMT